MTAMRTTWQMQSLAVVAGLLVSGKVLELIDDRTFKTVITSAVQLTVAYSNQADHCIRQY